jgi:hypothetical protein
MAAQVCLRALVGEALRNVIGNACEAMPNGGALHLSTTLNRMNGFVEISIADSGPGIAREDLERIFNLYFTTKKKRQRPRPAAGLARDRSPRRHLGCSIGGRCGHDRGPLAPETVEMSQAQPLARIG